MCAVSCASTARRRSAVHVSDVSGNSMTGRNKPATTGPRMRELMRIGPVPSAPRITERSCTALRASRSVITTVPNIHTPSRIVAGSVDVGGSVRTVSEALTDVVANAGTDVEMARCGTRHRSRGSSRTAANAHVQTKWRRAADRPRSRAASNHAIEKMKVIPIRIAVISSPLAARPLNHGGDTIQFFGTGFAIQQRGHHLFGRTVEEGFQQMTQRRSLRPLRRNFRQVDIRRALLLMPDVSLLFHNAKGGAHSRVAGRIGHGSLHRGRRRASAGNQDVHDLAFAARERVLLI